MGPGEGRRGEETRVEKEGADPEDRAGPEFQ